MARIDREKIIIELLDLLGRQDKKLYQEYCNFMFKQYNDLNKQKINGCTKKILALLFKNQQPNNLRLKQIFFPKIKYNTFEELINESFKFSKINKNNFEFLEIGFFIIRYIRHLENELKRKKLKGKTKGKINER